MSKGKPLFFKQSLKKSGFLSYVDLSIYLFVVLQDRIASVMLAQE